MKTYLVSEYYSGAMNVDKMRSFIDIVKAFEYWDSLGPNASGKRFYEVSDTEPPRLIKDKDRPQLKLHDFGTRGKSTAESAVLGGEYYLGLIPKDAK